MTKKLKQKIMAASAMMFTGLLSGVESAHANNFNVSTIVTNIGTSIAEVPGLIAGVSYMMGVVLGVLGILKIKDHVENPGQTPLQQGAIRLAAGGGLFALPFIFDVMQGSIAVDQADQAMDAGNTIGAIDVGTADAE